MRRKDVVIRRRESSGKIVELQRLLLHPQPSTSYLSHNNPEGEENTLRRNLENCKNRKRNSLFLAMEIPRSDKNPQ
jgi:hypothetical protein